MFHIILIETSSTWIMHVFYMLDVHEIANVNLPMHGHVDLIAWYHEKT